ncbi:MAG TPA: hypothetical protein VFS55_13495 [Dokdonella sp.]|nr:hypothetical protein [Dokdonella sp.]
MIFGLSDMGRINLVVGVAPRRRAFVGNRIPVRLGRRASVDAIAGGKPPIVARSAPPMKRGGVAGPIMRVGRTVPRTPSPG